MERFWNFFIPSFYLKCANGSSTYGCYRDNTEIYSRKKIVLDINTVVDNVFFSQNKLLLRRILLIQQSNLICEEV